MSTSSPPLPEPLRWRDRWRLRRRGRHDRGVDETLADGHTPFSLELLAQNKRGEHDVLAWLIEQRRQIGVPAPTVREVAQPAPTPAPPNFPEEVWAKRRQAAYEATVRAAEEASRTTVERAKNAERLLVAALEEAQVAASVWGNRFHEMAMIYSRARLAVRRDLTGWTIPPYTFESDFHLPPLPGPGVHLIRHPHLVKETPDAA